MVLFAVAGCSISIHALRVEGDRLDVALRETQLLFLSTPSGWRATVTINQQDQDAIFLSTPSGWRATAETADSVQKIDISIHALRVEGDSKNGQSFHLFLRKREKKLPL